MTTAITLSGESLIALKQANVETLNIDKMIFANVAGITENTPVDRNQIKPTAGEIQAELDINTANRVNDNVVVYSLTLESHVGTFSYNWIGLYSSEDDTLIAVAYLPEQEKRATVGDEVGNVLTKNFALEFNGAESVTGVTINAESWQLDYTNRLNRMDDIQRNVSSVLTDQAMFKDTGFKIKYENSNFYLSQGESVVDGLYLSNNTDLLLTVPALPKTAWLDVWQERSMTGVLNRFDVVYNDGSAMSESLQNGELHRFVKLAVINSTANIVDERINVTDSFALYHKGNMPSASTSQKGIVQLSDSVTSTSTTLSATAKAVKTAYDEGKAANDFISNNLVFTESITDQNIGRVTKVGDGGLLRDNQVSPDLDIPLYPNGLGKYFAGGTTANAYFTGHVLEFGSDATGITGQLQLGYNESKLAYRTTLSDWVDLWTTGNLVKQGSNIDSTAGRMMVNGAFGIGSHNRVSIPIASPMDDAPTGIFSMVRRSDGGNPPSWIGSGSYTGYIPVNSSSPVLEWGLLYDINNKSLYLTNNIAGNGADGKFSDPAKILTTRDATSSGGIAQRGSNANGDWVKFIDGTLICTHRVSYGGESMSAYGYLYEGDPKNWTFPATFVNVPSTSSDSFDIYPGIGFSIIEAQNTNTAVYKSVSTFADSATKTYGLTAIGRWK